MQVIAIAIQKNSTLCSSTSPVNDATVPQDIQTRDLALASMVRDDPHASSTAPASSTAATMCSKVGSEFETYISYNAPMHFRHRQTDTDIVA